MGEAFAVENSKAARAGDMPEQKVIFKYDGRNIAELEMRNDSRQHYGEVRFNMIKQPCVDMLRDFQPSPFDETKEYSPEIIAYGEAARTFGNWRKQT